MYVCDQAYQYGQDYFYQLPCMPSVFQYAICNNYLHLIQHLLLFGKSHKYSLHPAVGNIFSACVLDL